MKELETNLNMIQLRLFVDNSETILSQAEALGLPLYDCIVKFDLRECPPIVELYKYTEAYQTPEQKTWFEDTRSKEYITCAYTSSIHNGDESSQILGLQRFFPLEWLSEQCGRHSST